MVAGRLAGWPCCAELVSCRAASCSSSTPTTPASPTRHTHHTQHAHLTRPRPIRRVVLFKYMARTLAERAGCTHVRAPTRARRPLSSGAILAPQRLTCSARLSRPPSSDSLTILPLAWRTVRCTFMPKPFANLTGSGSHWLGLGLGLGF